MKARRTASDLSPVPLQAQQVFVFLDVVLDIDFHADLARSVSFQLADEIRPQADARLLVESLEADRDVDSRQECFVEGPDAVRGEEKDALVVLQGSQENRHQIVAHEVSSRSSFQEDIGLVQQ